MANTYNLVSLINAILNGKSATFVGLSYRTKGKPAAAHRDVILEKDTELTALAFQNPDDYGVYKRMVQRSAAKIEGNDPQKIEDFVPGEAWFQHDTPVFSLVSSKKNPDQKYFYHVPIKVKSVKYLVNNQVVTKEDYAKYLTPSSARELLSTGPKTHKSGGFQYTTVLRTVAVEHINRFRARGITITTA